MNIDLGGFDLRPLAKPQAALPEYIHIVEIIRVIDSQAPDGIGY